MMLNRFFFHLKNNKRLDKIELRTKSKFVKQHYELAFEEFQGEKKVSPFSYGLSTIYNGVYLYIRKQNEESLNYIKNFLKNYSG